MKTIQCFFTLSLTAFLACNTEENQDLKHPTTSEIKEALELHKEVTNAIYRLNKKISQSTHALDRAEKTGYDTLPFPAIERIAPKDSNTNGKKIMIAR